MENHEKQLIFTVYEKKENIVCAMYDDGSLGT